MKTYSRVVLILLFTLTGMVHVNAEESRNRWSVEIETLQVWFPGIQIIQAKVGRELATWAGLGVAELWAGVYLRPGVRNHDIVKSLDEYAGSITYRQYLWKDWHLEAMLFLGYAVARENLIDGRDYETLSILGEVSSGYRFSVFDTPSFGLYLLPQVGVLQGLPPTSIGPRGGVPDTFVTAKVLIGGRW